MALTDLTRLARRLAAAGPLAALALCAIPAAATAAPANVNLTPQSGNQVEGAIASDPQNANLLFAVAMNAAPVGGLAAARSSDGGATWTRYMVATGGAMPLAAADPSVAWDAYGNLYLSYIVKGQRSVEALAVSTDGGASFKLLPFNPYPVDQPTVVTGPGATPGSQTVWLSYSGSFGYMWAAGAQVKGAGEVGTFAAQAVEGTIGLSFGDIAVGPRGEVTMAVGPDTGSLGGGIHTATSPGIGGTFTAASLATATGVGGFESIPAQPTRGVDSEAGLAYDRSGGARNGRLYLMYNDASPPGSSATQIYVRHSEDNGATWSAPVKANDGGESASAFLPRLALDQANGALGVSWLDTREDPAANAHAQMWASFSSDGGETFTPNTRVSAGSSYETGADPPPTGYPDLDYGDYTGATFSGGRLFPFWADNSNSTGDNPDGTLTKFDMYTAAVPEPVHLAPQVSIVLPAPAASGWYTSVPVHASVAAQAPAGATIAGITCAGASVGTVTGLGTAAATAPIDVSAQGPSTVSCSAEDGFGAKGSSAPAPVQVDSQPPALAPTISPGAALLLNASASASPNASDPPLEGFASGLASASCEAVQTGSAGVETLSCTASDNAGNTVGAQLQYTVGYGFAGVNPGPRATFRRGGAIPVKMQLTDAAGAPIADALARSLGCAVTASYASGAPVCMIYNRTTRFFHAKVPVPATLAPGTYLLVLRVSAGGAVVSQLSVPVRAR